MGWRPDWAGAAKGGLEALEDIILGVEKEKKRRKKVDDEFNKQMELLDYQQQLGIDRGKIETYWEIALNENYNLETRQHFAELGGLVPPTTVGTVRPGGAAGVSGVEGVAGVEGLYSGGYTPPPPIGMFEPSAVAEEGEGELFGVVEKEKTHKEKVTRWVGKHPNKPYPGLSMEQTHKVLGAYIPPEKGPTTAERRLGMDAVSVAALIRQGKRIEKTEWGEQRFALTSKEDAINWAGEMGWTEKDPEYQQHITPAIEGWWGRYQPEKTAELKADQFIRRSVRKHLKDLQKKGVIDRTQKIDDEAIDFYIEDNLEDVVKRWAKIENR